MDARKQQPRFKIGRVTGKHPVKPGTGLRRLAKLKPRQGHAGERRVRFRF